MSCAHSLIMLRAIESELHVMSSEVETSLIIAFSNQRFLHPGRNDKSLPNELPFLQELANAVDCAQVDMMRSAAH